MKKISLWIILCLAALALSACGPAATAAEDPFIVVDESTTLKASQKETLTIALVMKTLTNPFFVEMEKGARQAEEDMAISLIVKTAAQETSIQQQIEIVEELVANQVDAIVIAPGDSKELIPALKKAQDAGIVVVNIDNRLDKELSAKLGLVNIPFISVDNTQGAYLSAKYIADQVTQPVKAVILEGIPEAVNAQDRKAGAVKAFAENPDIKVIASQTGHWKIDEAHDITAEFFKSDPDISLIFCANDMMALGAIQYLEEAKLDGVKVAGFDNLAEAQQAVRDGKLAATVDQQAARQGYVGVEYAVKMLTGAQVPAETFVDVILVTADTLK